MNLVELVATFKDSVKNQGQLSIEKRIDRLKTLKRVIDQKEKSISEALKKDLGKSAFEAFVTEVGFIKEEITFVLKNLKKWTRPKKVRTPLTLFPGKSFIYPEPYGVVLIIAPWNYPFQLCFSPLIGALAAGNRVVLKPSEFAPHTAREISIIINEVFANDEVSVVEGGMEETKLLLNQPFDYIFFTGSPRVGKEVMKAAAENLIPVTLELGGKSPCLIEESADLNMAAKRCVWGKFLNAGQTCVSPDYIYVPRKSQNHFIDLLVKHIHAFFGEDPLRSQDYPRIINSHHFDRLEKLIYQDKLAYGGKTLKEENFIGPTILKDITWNDEIMKEEIFGPILPILPYDELEAAVKKVLEMPKPLALYVFSQDEQKSEDIISRVSFGGGCINDTVIHLANPNLPFGGVGTSGFGSYHGLKSFETFTHYKSIFKQGKLVDIPLRYPPYEGKLNWLKMIIR